MAWAIRKEGDRVGVGLATSGSGHFRAKISFPINPYPANVEKSVNS
jgi:hypothetical protein